MFSERCIFRNQSILLAIHEMQFGLIKQDDRGIQKGGNVKDIIKLFPFYNDSGFKAIEENRV